MSITRRDFLDGFALSVGAALLPQARAGGQELPTPAQATGLRGSTAGSYEVAHALRDGRRFTVSDTPISENFDLVIVGAGISGLAAAWSYREQRPEARILIVDNHDDFGGHAQRNEFTVGDRLLIGYGGSESIQTPSVSYSAAGLRLLDQIGVNLKTFGEAFDQNLYPDLGLSRGIWFDRESFGEDRLVTGDPTPMADDDIPATRRNARPIESVIADYPLSSESKARLISLYTSTVDPMRGKSLAEKMRTLQSISYREYVKRFWGLDDHAAQVLQGRTLDYDGTTISSVPALDGFAAGLPGRAALALGPLPEEVRAALEEPYIHHFPDGNASIARLLVRKLIPGFAPGSTMEDMLTAKVNYSALDLPASRVRLRLSSTVVNLRNRGTVVEVSYIQSGAARRVSATHCIFAGYSMMVPYICPELSFQQRAALALNVKAPMAYVNVAVRNWQPWAKLGVHQISSPTGFYSTLKLDYPVSLGTYRCSRTANEPIVLHLMHVPRVSTEGLDMRAVNRLGRAKLYATTFADFESHLRDELTRIFGNAGFDADRDIAGITVNRWGHGYSYSGNTLYDSAAFGEKIMRTARARAGGLAFAGSDSGWMPLASAAIAEANRAVHELLHGG